MTTLQPNEDLTPYIGQRIKIEKLGLTYTGELKGRGAIVAIKAPHTPPDSLWTILEGTTEYHFSAPGDGWVIHVL
jgi:hypothetical protein